MEVAKYSRQNKDDKCREKPALERRRDCVIAKMNTDRRRKSVFGKCGIMRRCVSWVAVHGSQCGSLEVSENSEALNEGKGSRIVCDWTRSVKREQHVRHDPSAKKAVIHR